MLNNKQSVELNKHSTGFTERKVQQTLRKIKLKLLKNIYAKLCPAGSSLGNFYGSAKIQ